MKEGNRDGFDLEYQTAVQMLLHEGNQVWSRFNVFVAANSIIIATIAVLLTSETTSRLLPGLIAGIGIMFCVLAAQITRRGFQECQAYFWYAIDLEHGSNIRFMRATDAFGKGEQSTFRSGDGTRHLKLSRAGRLFSIPVIALLMIGAFVLAYVVLLAYAIFALHP